MNEWKKRRCCRCILSRHVRLRGACGSRNSPFFASLNGHQPDVRLVTGLRTIASLARTLGLRTRGSGRRQTSSIQRDEPGC